MKLLRFVLAIVLSLFATAVMSYISMALPIGPWMESTLVLAAMVIVGLCCKVITISEQAQTLGLSTVAGGIGGILATGFGFSFPMLYFTSPDIFMKWLSHPFYFCGILSALAFSAGALGLCIAHFSEHKLIVEYNLPFPIGSMVNKMINAQNQLNKAIQLALGFVLTQLLLFARRCLRSFPENIILLSKNRFGAISIPSIVLSFDLIPMLLAVGFITGYMIAVPLGAGLIAKSLIISPLYYLYIQWGGVVNNIDFTIAFSTGIVVYGALVGTIGGIPKLFKSFFKSFACAWGRKEVEGGLVGNRVKNHFSFCSMRSFFKSFYSFSFWHLAISIISFVAVMSFFEFSLISQLYLFLFSIVCCYQLAEIAGKIGLAPLGRFATFVLVPGLLLFGYTSVQAMVVSTFVEVAGGVACDALFGRKFAYLANIKQEKVIYYQWLGLICSALAVGVVFWLLISQFGLASHELPVQKALSRALLLNVKTFNVKILVIGGIFGCLVSKMKINPVLMLGGILMPESISIVLIVGGFLAYCIKDKESWYPFWSGVFAANSLWMLIKALFNNIC